MRSPSWAASCCIPWLKIPTWAMQWTLGVNNLLNYNYTQLERNLGEIRNEVVAVNGSF